MDALDFAQPDGMNLLRRQVRGGVLARQKRVHGRPIRILPYSDLIEAGREVVFDEELFEALEGGNHACADGLFRGLDEPCLVGFAYGIVSFTAE